MKALFSLVTSVLCLGLLASSSLASGVVCMGKDNKKCVPFGSSASSSLNSKGEPKKIVVDDSLLPQNPNKPTPEVGEPEKMVIDDSNLPQRQTSSPPVSIQEDKEMTPAGKIGVAIFVAFVLYGIYFAITQILTARKLRS